MDLALDLAGEGLRKWQDSDEVDTYVSPSETQLFNKSNKRSTHESKSL